MSWKKRSTIAKAIIGLLFLVACTQAIDLTVTGFIELPEK
jgi:hypothetical protein